MGWKAIKEAYQIKHYVQVTDEGICIGSPYIHNIIVIDRNGTLKKREPSSINADLCRYQRELEADPEKAKRLIEQKDTFKKSVPVYTYQGRHIIEKQCEELGWPNVTHDGEMMYENVFFADRDEAIRQAKDSLKNACEFLRDNIKRLEAEVASECEALVARESDYAALLREYPDSE